MAKAKEDAAAIMKQKQAACMSCYKPYICLNAPRSSAEAKKAAEAAAGKK